MIGYETVETFDKKIVSKVFLFIHLRPDLAEKSYRKRMSQLEFILSTASKLFIHYGIKSVSMDDISQEAGISKKTLYQFVEDKKDLVNQTFAFYLKLEESDCLNVCFKEENPIDQLYTISARMSNNLRSMNPSLFIDLRKNYPEAWACLEKHRVEFIYNNVKNNLESGVKDGWYRADLNIEFVSRLYISMIDKILDHEVYPPAEFPFYKLVRSMIKYHLNAMVSEKGKKYLTRKWDKYFEENLKDS